MLAPYIWAIIVNWDTLNWFSGIAFIFNMLLLGILFRIALFDANKKSRDEYYKKWKCIKSKENGEDEIGS